MSRKRDTFMAGPAPYYQGTPTQEAAKFLASVARRYVNGRTGAIDIERAIEVWREANPRTAEEPAIGVEAAAREAKLTRQGDAPGRNVDDGARDNRPYLPGHHFALLAAAYERAKAARDKFGPHRSAEFACCRLAEETGELIQAATAMSKGRDHGRRERMRDEATDVLAMVLRLLDEFPDGMPS